MISVLILTKNEEGNLPGCLESVRWSDDVHVLDSGSTDATVAIARAAGANVVARTPRGAERELFGGNEAEHKNWALANIPFKHRWVLHLDADERVTGELRTSMRKAVEAPGEFVAFRIRRRDFWGKRWLKHVQTSAYYLRLFRPEKIRYERLINPVSIPDGPVGELGGLLDHYPFSKGMSDWLNRHNSYSTLEAKQTVRNRTANHGFKLTEAFVGKDFNERRFHQKELFYRLPGRPAIKFLTLYFLKGGILDGPVGFRYAVLQSFYEYMIVLKTKELTAREKANEFEPASESFRNVGAADVKNLVTNSGSDD
jgi:glycosyltransferase involved in cell wall biosynthesis